MCLTYPDTFSINNTCKVKKNKKYTNVLFGNAKYDIILHLYCKRK